MPKMTSDENGVATEMAVAVFNKMTFEPDADLRKEMHNLFRYFDMVVKKMNEQAAKEAQSRDPFAYSGLESGAA